MAAENIDDIVGKSAIDQVEYLKKSLPELAAIIKDINTSLKGSEFNIKNAGSVSELNKTLGDAAKKQGELNTATALYKDAVKAQADAVRQANKEKTQSDKDYVDTWKRLLKEQDDASKAQSKAEQIRKTQLRELDKASAKEAVELQKAVAKEISNLEKQKAQLDKAVDKELAKIEKASTAYAILNNQYKNNADESKNYGAQITILQNELEDLNKTEGASKATIAGKVIELSRLKGLYDQTTASSQKYYKQLLTLEETVGQGQRKVGQYQQAIFSLSQILREAPSFAYSFATGLLGISNNIPILVDDLNKLKAAGQSNIQILKGLGTSLLTTGNIITLVVSALTIAVAWFTMHKNKVEEVDEATKKLNKSQEDLANSIGKETAELSTLYKTAQNVNLSYKERGDAVDKLQKEYPAYFGNISREKILNGEVAGTYDLVTEAIVRRAKATAEQKNLTDLYSDLAAAELKLQTLTTQGKNRFVYADQDAIESLKQTISYKKDQIKTTEQNIQKTKDDGANTAYWLDYNLKKQYEANQAKEKANALLTEEERKELNKKPKKGRTPTDADPLEVSIENNRAIFENETESLNKRLAALEEFSRLEIQVVQNMLNKKLITENKYNQEVAKITNDGEKKKTEIIEKEIKKQTQLILDQLNNIATNNNAARQTELNALVAQLQAQKITYTEYNAQKIAINEKYNAQLLTDTKDYLSEQLAAEGLNEEEIRKIQEKITDVENKQLQLRNQNAEKLGQKRLEADRKIVQQRKELEQELANFISSVINSSIERQIQGLEDRTDAINKERDNTIAAANAAAISEEDRANRVAVANAKATQEQQDNDKKISELKRKEAIFNKGLAIAGIGVKLAETLAAINLAAAELDAISFGVAGAAYRAYAIPFAVALATVQTATVLATAIPKYKLGIDEHPGGPAIMGDGGVSEAVIEPTGEVWMTASKATLYPDLTPGARVIPGHELNRIYNPVLNIQSKDKQPSYKEIVDAFDMGCNKIVRAVNNKKTVSVKSYDSNWTRYENHSLRR